MVADPAEDARSPSPFREAVERHGGAPPLIEGLAAIAAEERPGVDPDALLSRVDALASRARSAEGAPVWERAARLNHALLVEAGFGAPLGAPGSPDPLLLDHVLDTGRGLPVLLCAVYAEAARRTGTGARVVLFPGRPVVGFHDARPRFFVDPFEGGAVLRDADLRERLRRMAGAACVEPATWTRWTSPASDRDVLLRVNRVLHRIQSRRDDVPAALRAVERALLLAPDEPELHRDRGVLLARLGHCREAREEVAIYLEALPDAWDAEAIRRVVG